MGFFFCSVSDDVHYFLQDAQNSTVALADDTGTITSSYTYDAFGNLSDTASIETSYLYTGQQFDPVYTELYNLRARQYDPSNGRFLSRDKWAYNYSNPIELNRYVYTANNPVNYNDPSGNNLGEWLSSLTVPEQMVVAVSVVTVVILLEYLVLVAYINCGINFCSPDFMDALTSLAEHQAKDMSDDQLTDAIEDTVLSTDDQERSSFGIRPFVPSWQRSDTSEAEREREAVTTNSGSSGEQSVDIALGLTSDAHDRPILAPFAAGLSTNDRIVVPWMDWSDHGITTYSQSDFAGMPTDEFAEIVHTILVSGTFGAIHVNLESVQERYGYSPLELEEFIEAHSDRLYGDELSSTPLAVELGIIVDEDLCDDTTFYLNGSVPTARTEVTTDICG